MPNRHFTNVNTYRYGFNGKENDNEITSGTQDFGAREYDARLGKFFTQDKFATKFADQSPYLFAGNSPIRAIDINGDSIYFVNGAGIFKAAMNLILKIEDADGLFKEAYASSSINIYISSSTSGSESGLNIPDLNPFAENGIIVNETGITEVVNQETGLKSSSAAFTLPDYAVGILGLKIDTRDQNSVIFVNFLALQEDAIAEVAATLIHEEYSHIKKGASHQSFGVGQKEGSNLVRNPESLTKGSAAENMSKKIKTIQDSPGHKARTEKFDNLKYDNEAREAAGKNTAKPIKYIK